MLRRLPLFLAALSLLVLALSTLCEFSALCELTSIPEPVAFAFLLLPLLFYSWVGLIHWSLLGGDPRLFGSPWAADAVYALTWSVVRSLIGKLIVTLFRLRR